MTQTWVRIARETHHVHEFGQLIERAEVGIETAVSCSICEPVRRWGQVICAFLDVGVEHAPGVVFPERIFPLLEEGIQRFPDGFSGSLVVLSFINWG